MLLARPVGPGVVGYYLDGRSPGLWVGAGCADLRLSGQVERVELKRVLEGRHPFDGEFLPRVRRRERRSGWDLVFAAPKSLSLLEAGAGAADPHRSIRAAHRAAVADVLDHIELSGLSVKSGGTRVRTTGAVAAAFEHLTNSEGKPHLHTHLLLANIGHAGDGRWSAVSGSEWWPRRRAVGAMYQLSLRHNLAVAGWDLEWRLRPDGLADIADVGRAAIRAASRGGGLSPTGTHTVTTVESDRTVDDRPRSTTSGPELHSRRLQSVVETRLAAAASTFCMQHAVVALAASYPGGLTAQAAWSWAEDFCRASVPATSAPRVRYSTPLAVRADQRLEALMAERAPEVTVLAGIAGRTLLFSHASRIASLAETSQEDRERLAVRTRDRSDAIRWRTLAGIDSADASSRVDVLFVDQADRWPTPQLLALLDSNRCCRIVFMEGGTLPRLSIAASAGLERAGDRLGRLAPVPSSTLGQAAGDLIRSWADMSASGHAPLLVGLGLEEAEALNAAARSVAVVRGHVAGPELTAAGRDYRSGDRVIALRRCDGVSRGALGTVKDLDARRKALRVAWDHEAHRSKPSLLEGGAASSLGHGYATTARLAVRTGAPLLLLGPPEALGRGQARVVDSAMAPPILDRVMPGRRLDPVTLEPAEREPAGRVMPL
jgi:conjugative relaxase-like TrwC/TraI family protein